MTWFIYSLSDPRDGKVRYVGSTVEPNSRLSGHLTSARRRSGLTLKDKWVKSLLSQKRNPTISIIESGTVTSSRKTREAFWISAFSASGCDLFNINTPKCGKGWQVNFECPRKYQKPLKSIAKSGKQTVPALMVSLVRECIEAPTPFDGKGKAGTK